MADSRIDPVIRVAGLRTRLGDRLVHSNVNLEVGRGEILGVIGASGSGKTALLKQVAGLLQPESGQAEVLGVDVHRASWSEARELRKRWGILYQNGALFSALTVFDNVAFPLRELARYGEALEEDMVRELTWLKLAMVHFEPEDAWKLPGELSGGMVKRAALARALALEAELLFLDEPTTGLDPILAREFTDLLGELRKELGLSGLMISHDLDALASLGDRIAVLGEGCILTTGSLEEVAQVDHPFIQDLFTPTRGQERMYRLSHPGN